MPALGDAHAYHVLAKALADGRGYIRPYDFERKGVVIRTAEYPPAFPAVLAAGDKLGLRTIDQQRLLLCGRAASPCCWSGWPAAPDGDDGRSRGGRRAAVYPMLFQADAALMPETLAALGGAAVCCWRCGRAAASVRSLGGARRGDRGVGARCGPRRRCCCRCSWCRWPGVCPAPTPAGGCMLAAVAFGVAAAVVLPWTVRNALDVPCLRTGLEQHRLGGARRQLRPGLSRAVPGAVGHERGRRQRPVIGRSREPVLLELPDPPRRQRSGGGGGAAGQGRALTPSITRARCRA